MHLLLLLPGLVWGHGAVVHPPPRNRVGKLTKIGSRVEKECIKSFKSHQVDSGLPPWSGPVPDPLPGVDAWSVGQATPVPIISSFQLRFSWLRMYSLQVPRF